MNVVKLSKPVTVKEGDIVNLSPRYTVVAHGVNDIPSDPCEFFYQMRVHKNEILSRIKFEFAVRSKVPQTIFLDLWRKTGNKPEEYSRVEHKQVYPVASTWQRIAGRIKSLFSH